MLWDWIVYLCQWLLFVDSLDVLALGSKTTVKSSYIYYRYLTHAIIRMFVFFFSFAKLKYFSLDYSHLLPCHHNRHLRMFNLTQVLCQMFFLMQPHILLHGNDVLLWFSLGFWLYWTCYVTFLILFEIFTFYMISVKRKTHLTWDFLTISHL